MCAGSTNSSFIPENQLLENQQARDHPQASYGIFMDWISISILLWCDPTRCKGAQLILSQLLTFEIVAHPAECLIVAPHPIP